MKKVMFVCSGNTCRSPMAEGLFKKYLEDNAITDIEVSSAGISAFPMASRIVQRMATKEDPQNFILMQAAGANVAGQLGSVVAGGLVLSLVPMLLGA